MIYVDRSTVPIPPILRSPKAKEARERAKAYYLRSYKQRLQTRFEFDSSVWMATLESLGELFHGKCAYCESAVVGVSFGDVEMHRPKSSARDLSGAGDQDGYWWLAYEWENLYLVCRRCNASKQSYFPVKNRRATYPAHGEQLRREGPLLLDPCFDRPELYLQFDAMGRVRPRSGPGQREPYQAEPEERALTTIKILSLNRVDLVKWRRNVASETRARLSEISKSDDNLTLTELVERIKDIVSPAHQFTAMRRQIVESWLSRPRGTPSKVEPGILRSAILEVIPQVYGSEVEQDGKRRTAKKPTVRKTAVKKRIAARKTRAKKTSATPEAGTRGKTTVRKAAAAKRKVAGRATSERTASRSRRRRPPSLPRGETGYLEKVEIRNFRSIRNLTISFPVGESDSAGWKVLLGENGVGKSTVLKAIALALKGRALMSKLGVKPNDLLRKLGGNQRAKSGLVRLQFTSSEAPIEMRFSPRKIEWSHQEGARVEFLRAYGVTRLLPGRGHRTRAARRKKGTDVENLFNPYDPVADADAFFADMNRNKKLFGSAALSLKDLLRVSSRVRVRVQQKRVRMWLNGVPISLDEMSDGYQSLAVLATDIMAGVLGTVRDLRYATGLVLLDEIDAHLHPRWKMEIVKRLRSTFPRIQFIATTHEPLCLRGLKDGEVTVFRRNGKRIEMLDNVPSTEGMRVDQLLTSNLFGLHTTIDPELDEKFAAYYELLARDKATLTQKEKAYRDELKLELAKCSVLGHTRRDQLAYEAIDEYLAKELEESPVKLRDLREATKRKVARIWSGS